jgi:hypothetical protein
MDLPHQFPPSMLAYPEPIDFDYNAFLQPQDDFGFHSHHHHHHHHHSPALGSPAQPRQMSVQLGVPTPTAAFSDSSLNKATPPSSDNNNNNNNSIRGMSQELVRQTPAQKRLERRGHTKSRRGCYNCKRRRIKVNSSTHGLCDCLSFSLICADARAWEPTVPGDASRLWSLCEDRPQVRIPFAAPNHPSASSPDPPFQSPGHALLPTFPDALLPSPSP